MTRELRIKGKPIPRQKIESIWKTLTDRPLPDVKGFRVKHKNFIKFHKTITDTRCEDRAVRTDEWEYGNNVPFFDAFCVRPDPEAPILIIIDEINGGFDEALRHELNHVLNKDEDKLIQMVT